MLPAGQVSIRGVAMRRKDYQQVFVRNLANSQPSLRAFIPSLPPNRGHASVGRQDTNLVISRRSAQFTEGTNFLAFFLLMATLVAGVQLAVASACAASYAQVDTRSDAGCGTTRSWHETTAPLRESTWSDLSVVTAKSPSFDNTREGVTKNFFKKERAFGGKIPATGGTGRHYNPPLWYWFREAIAAQYGGSDIC
jgi:hypothetical protein